MENESLNLLPNEENETVEEPTAPVEETCECTAEEASACEDTCEETCEDTCECECECECKTENAAKKMARKCAEAKQACCGSIARVARNLRESNYNPYIKQTRTYKLEIYRNCNEDEPIDVYETVDEKSFSACALAVATAATAALVIATKCIAKKLFK
ncbi:MAG: hypothetical protein IJW30_05720 [Clostridia bacterium]|nr:hypothetical protein [Clostridia bacterium]